MSTRTLAAQWASYRERVMPVNAPPIQVSETRLGFYAGAAAMFDLLVMDLSPGPEPTEGDIDHMSALHQELRDFSNSIKSEIPT